MHHRIRNTARAALCAALVGSQYRKLRATHVARSPQCSPSTLAPPRNRPTNVDARIRTIAFTCPNLAFIVRPPLSWLRAGGPSKAA